MGVDLNGKLLQSPAEFDDNWKHVAVGLGTYSPLSYSDIGITFKFKKPGTTTVYLDNVRIKNLKGEVVYEIFEDEVVGGKMIAPTAKIQ
jgi:hypothetical protein